MTRLVLLSGGASIHTIRWANGLADAGIEVNLITQQPLLEPVRDEVNVHVLPDRGSLGYFTMVPTVRRLIRRLAPDVVNAHYASGYGTTARLVGYRPYVLSVWGSDVYDFPTKSRLHRYWVRRNLEAADIVASTSRCMAAHTKGLAPDLAEIPITPFGVERDRFEGVGQRDGGDEGPDRPIVVGTVKSMAAKYGVDTLIQAFACTRRRLLDEGDARASRLCLRLVGDGPQLAELEELARKCGVAGVTKFVGRVAHEKVPEELDRLDIYVALSRLDSESFGVAIIEAGAAGRPVVVSDAGGLPEVTLDGETGFVVPREDPEAAAQAILKLVRDPVLRADMGKEGQKHVAQNYSWSACVAKMKEVYQAAIDGHQENSRYTGR
ncbi:glycosyltransferase [Thioalkalivibrio sp. ALgr1]|uniref:glycosyltransferase n=1 Tax=Thioalkalivibrio sp. ALgr1 TaxID=748655 RepID=UPI0012E9A692|nr:glycosyltransferase [Thioalkalivibrio sp. ALgr1]